MCKWRETSCSIRLKLTRFSGHARPETISEYDAMHTNIEKFVAKANAAFKSHGYPIELANWFSVWSMMYTQPGRYHWMLQVDCTPLSIFDNVDDDDHLSHSSDCHAAVDDADDYDTNDITNNSNW